MHGRSLLPDLSPEPQCLEQPNLLAVDEWLIRHQAALKHRLLVAQIWGDDYFGDDNVVDMYMRYLRRKLEDIKPGRIIQTIRGIGFALRIDE